LLSTMAWIFVERPPRLILRRTLRRGAEHLHELNKPSVRKSRRTERVQPASPAEVQTALPLSFKYRLYDCRLAVCDYKTVVPVEIEEVIYGPRQLDAIANEPSGLLELIYITLHSIRDLTVDIHVAVSDLAMTELKTDIHFLTDLSSHVPSGRQPEFGAGTGSNHE
jgi:hypothetical protein